jgi:hypothetical protein
MPCWPLLFDIHEELVLMLLLLLPIDCRSGTFAQTATVLLAPRGAGANTDVTNAHAAAAAAAYRLPCWHI